jgi:hypothetical protein
MPHAVDVYVVYSIVTMDRELCLGLCLGIMSGYHSCVEQIYIRLRTGAPYKSADAPYRW